MCAEARHSPTTDEEKNSFERSPRRVNISPSRSCPGCDLRYIGSAAGISVGAQSGAQAQVVKIGAADSLGSVVLSAKGNLSLAGHDVLVGGAVDSAGTTAPVRLEAGKNVNLTATGIDGHVVLQGGNFDTSFGHGFGSIQVNAGGNISLTGKHVIVHGGSAVIDIGSISDVTVDVHTDVDLTAHGNVTITGAADVDISGGKASIQGTASAGDDTLTADASVSITAHRNIKVTGPVITLQGGTALVKTKAAGTSVGVDASADAGVSLLSLQHGGSISLTGGSSSTGQVHIVGGVAGRGGLASAIGDKSRASAEALAGVSITGPALRKLVIKADRVDISAGAAGAGSGTGSSVLAMPATDLHEVKHYDILFGTTL